MSQLNIAEIVFPQSGWEKNPLGLINGISNIEAE